MKVNLSNYLFPVKSIFITLGDASPSTFLGGTWEEIEGGRFLMSGTEGGTIYTVSSNTAAPKSYTLSKKDIGQTGGYALNGIVAKASAYHGTRVGSDTSYPVSASTGIEAGTTVVNAQAGTAIDDANVALNTSVSSTLMATPFQLHSTVTFNNYPPYLIVHIWQRTA